MQKMVNTKYWNIYLEVTTKNLYPVFSPNILYMFIALECLLFVVFMFAIVY